MSMNSGKIILLVDDDLSVLTSIKRLLTTELPRKFHYKILLAENADEGLEIMSENNVDLVISDQRMPEMSGLAFLYLAARRSPRTIRILLTAHDECGVIMRAVNEIGLFSFLLKPWQKSELLDQVKSALELSDNVHNRYVWR